LAPLISPLFIDQMFSPFFPCGAMVDAYSIESIICNTLGINQSFHGYDLVSFTNFNFMCFLQLYKIELKFVTLFCSLMLILQLIYNLCVLGLDMVYIF
jgi:hypothetical protein